MAPWGHGVVRLEESWDSDWEWPSLYYTELFQPLPSESGKGNCLATNQGGFWVGFPTQVQEEEQMSVSLESSVEGHSGAESSHL